MRLAHKAIILRLYLAALIVFNRARPNPRLADARKPGIHIDFRGFIAVRPGRIVDAEGRLAARRVQRDLAERRLLRPHIPALPHKLFWSPASSRS